MADTIEKPVGDTGYDKDFFLWTQQQADLLRQAARDRGNAPIDWENVAEEIESLGGRDRREVKSLVRHILAHLIKLQVSTLREPRNHWRQEIVAARDNLEDALHDSPSLKARLPEFVESEWSRAVREATRSLEDDEEGARAIRTLVYLNLAGPNADNVLDPDFFPKSPASP